MLVDEVTAFADCDALEQAMGLSSLKARRIGAIFVFASNAEFRLEQAIWRLEGHAPKGQHHQSDKQPVTLRINALERAAAQSESAELRTLLTDWCAASRAAFQFRNDIAHGAALNFGAVISFERNRSWFGEVRSKAPSRLYGDDETLEHLRQTFGTLLRVISAVSNPKRPLETCASSARLKAVRWARGLMEELTVDHGDWVESY